MRRDDGGSAAISLQSLANKDYGAIKNKSGRRGVTARDVADSKKISGSLILPCILCAAIML